MKQPDKLTAYYFRAALQTDTLYLATKISSEGVYLDKQAFNAS